MIIYNISRQNVTLSGTTPFLTIVSGSTRSFLIIELDVEGDSNASAYNEIGLYRVTTAGSGAATAITTPPAPVDSPNMTGTTPALAFSGAANASYATTQPTVGTLVHNIPVNANGQRYFWRANPNMSNAIVVPGGANAAGSVSFAPISGTSPISIRVQVAEF
jgi:hypothetical protein